MEKLLHSLAELDDDNISGVELNLKFQFEMKIGDKEKLVVAILEDSLPFEDDFNELPEPLVKLFCEDECEDQFEDLSSSELAWQWLYRRDTIWFGEMQDVFTDHYRDLLARMESPTFEFVRQSEVFNRFMDLAKAKPNMLSPTFLSEKLQKDFYLLGTVKDRKSLFLRFFHIECLLRWMETRGEHYEKLAFEFSQSQFVEFERDFSKSIISDVEKVKCILQDNRLQNTLEGLFIHLYTLRKDFGESLLEKIPDAVSYAGSSLPENDKKSLVVAIELLQDKMIPLLRQSILNLWNGYKEPERAAKQHGLILQLQNIFNIIHISLEMPEYQEKVLGHSWMGEINAALAEHRQNFRPDKITRDIISI